MLPMSLKWTRKDASGILRTSETAAVISLAWSPARLHRTSMVRRSQPRYTSTEYMTSAGRHRLIPGASTELAQGGPGASLAGCRVNAP